MLTACSAINQQIAIKTVRKYGFSVNAVWNGKEALDYLAAEADPSRPKPDIILMDVQMPVLDGYSATHMIRYHKPYSSLDDIRNLPIIAMTASAIQGDKEKCQNAGMDDYLAKPVKGVALERMLMKWAVQDKRKYRHFLPKSGSHDDNCTGSDSPSLFRVNSSEQRKHSFSADKAPKPADIIQAQDLTHNHPQSLSSSSADARERSRVAANEKASSLRTEKLLMLASEPSDSRTTILPHMSVSPPPMEPNEEPSAMPLPSLTEENINQLSLQHQSSSSKHSSIDSIGLGLRAPPPYQHHVNGSVNADAGSSMPPDSASASVQRDSSEVEREGMSTVGSLRGVPKSGGGGVGVRGWLNRHESDRSQVTVRAEDYWRGSPKGGEVVKEGMEDEE